MARFIACSKCHAEISDDREACPHCGTEVISESRASDKLREENAELKAQLAKSDSDIAKENADMKAKLAKQAAPATI